METIYIEIATGPNSGHKIELANRTLVFGRTKGSDVLLDWDTLVSSRHFKIQKDENCYVLHDLDSTNGTMVNGRGVQSHALTNGDRISVGKTVMLVKGSGEAPSTSTSKEKVYVNPFESSIGPRFVPSASEAEAEAEAEQTERSQLPAYVTPTPPANQGEPTSLEMVKSPVEINANESSNIVDSSEMLGFTQIRLRVTSREENGKLFWLNLGQSSTFGRTEKSDCSVPSDLTLSSEHFRVTCEADQCTIEDLQSRTGVWLNGKKIAKAQLRNGDQVLAGATEFLIEIQGIAAAISSADSGNASPLNHAPPKLRPSSKRLYDVSRTQCACEIVRLRGKVFEPDDQSDVGIVEFFETMHAFAPLQVLIDFSRISLPLPKEIDAESHSLFDWLPSGAIEKSPMLFALDELANWKAYVEEGWGSDAVIGLRSELPREELLAKLRDLLMGSAHGPEASKGILGFCWPSVLEALMENNPNGFTDSFFADLSLVLIEKQGKPENWQLFGKEAQVEQAMKIGMRIVKEKAEELATNKTS